MNIITNEKLIQRNRRIGQVTTLAALAVLGGGMYISFTMPEQFNLALVALFLGFILSQVGLYFGNRWGRSPRPDQKLDQALKGLGNNYTLYHYAAPVPHLLVGPAGIWALVPLHQSGSIRYQNKRWRQSGGGFLMAYMRLFGQENIGRPELIAEQDLAGLRRFLERRLDDPADLPRLGAALVFLNEKAELELEPDEPPFPALPVRKLKEFIRKKAKAEALPETVAARVNALLTK
jgi:hypothetical protein